MCASFSLLSAYLGHKSLVETEYYLRLPNRCTPRPCCPICKEGRGTEMSKKGFGGVFLGRPPPREEGMLAEDRDIVPRCASPPHRFPGKGSRHAVALDDIDALSVEAFLDHPESDRDDGISTRNQRQAALNSFFSFARARKPAFYSKIMQEMGVPRKHSTPPVTEYLTVAEVEALFSSIDDSTKHGLREKAMIGFPYEAAARVGELTSFRHCRLRLGDASTSSRTGREARRGTLPSQWDTRS